VLSLTPYRSIWAYRVQTLSAGEFPGVPPLSFQFFGDLLRGRPLQQGHLRNGMPIR
jgi:hypothetical protein